MSGYLGTPLVFGKSGTSLVLDSPSTDKSKKLTKLLELLKGSDFILTKLKKLSYELKKFNAEISELQIYYWKKKERCIFSASCQRFFSVSGTLQ